MRPLLAVLAIGLAGLAVTATAAAERPVMFTDRLTVTTPGFNFSCAPYGYSFNALATFTVERRYIQFYDDAGRLVKEIRHVDFEGTLHRSNDLSKTIPYGGKWTRTTYPLEDVAVETGLFRYSHPGGSGTVELNAGRQVVKATPPGTVYEETAQTRAEYQQGVCAYLAAQ